MTSEARSGRLSPHREAADAWLQPKIERVGVSLVRHWLFAINVLNGMLFAGAFLAPALVAAGARLPAKGIYFFYTFVCHQLPSRSYFIFGHQVAQCHRNTAIFAALTLGGIAYALFRQRLRPIDWRIYGALILPMAIDGTTQLVGWRESSWELRTITGALFGLASVWFLFPFVDRQLRRAAQPTAKRHHVILYGKPGCSLCDKAKELLDRLSASYPMIMEQVDISDDPELRQRFNELIPVVYIDGRAAAVSKVSEVWLRRKLDEAAC